MMFCVGGRHTHPRKINKVSALDIPAKRLIFGILACNNPRQMPNLQFNTTQVSRFLVARRVLKRLLHPSIVARQEWVQRFPPILNLKIGKDHILLCEHLRR